MKANSISQSQAELTRIRVYKAFLRLGFVSCFVVAYISCVMLFPPTIVRTPFNFVIAFSVFLGLLFGGFAFFCDIGMIVHRAQNEPDQRKGGEKKITEWTSTFAYLTYALITIGTVIAASVWLATGPIVGFGTAKESFGSVDRIGSSVKDVVAVSLRSQDVIAARNLDNRQIGESLLISVLEKSADSAYRRAVDGLEGIALLVVIGFFLADVLGYWKGDRSAYATLVLVDLGVLAFHLFSLYASGNGFPGIFEHFNSSMVQSFCGGLLGLSLIIQYSVFAYVLSKS